MHFVGKGVITFSKKKIRILQKQRKSTMDGRALLSATNFILLHDIPANYKVMIC